LVVVDHVLFVVEDFAASRRLYTAALAPMGFEELYVKDDGVGYGADGLDDFSISQGSPVTVAAHVAFDAPGREAVDAFFEAAIANGATARGEPGVWTQYSRPVLRGVRERSPRQQRGSGLARSRAGDRRPDTVGRAIEKRRLVQQVRATRSRRGRLRLWRSRSASPRHLPL
jgi:hypothetical protein